MKTEVEKSLNEKLLQRIKYLEHLNSLLKQTNKLLSNKLISLTKKYNDLKNELFDTECHINFCKKNLTELIAFKKEEDKDTPNKNFLTFKNKINSLFGYGDNFMKINSEITIYNIIIDNIQSIQEENINLRKSLDEMHKILYNSNESNNDNNYYKNKGQQYLSSNSNKIISITSEDDDKYNNYETPYISDLNYSEQNNEMTDDNLLIYKNNKKNYFNRLYYK